MNKRFKRGPKSTFVWLKRLFLTQSEAGFKSAVGGVWVKNNLFNHLLNLLFKMPFSLPASFIIIIFNYFFKIYFKKIRIEDGGVNLGGGNCGHHQQGRYDIAGW